MKMGKVTGPAKKELKKKATSQPKNKKTKKQLVVEIIQNYIYFFIFQRLLIYITYILYTFPAAEAITMFEQTIKAKVSKYTEPSDNLIFTSESFVIRLSPGLCRRTSSASSKGHKLLK